MTDDTNPKDRLGEKKPGLFYIPDTAMLHLAMAMRDGALKYGPFNWRDKKVKASIYLSALERHRMGWASGERQDPLTRVHHLGAIMACCAILIDAEETGNLIDDRACSPAVPLLLDDLEDQIAEELRDVEGRIVGWKSTEE